MTQAPGLVEKIRFGTGLPRYLRKPLTLDGARTEIRERLDHRSNNFLASMRLVVFERPSSPYLRLFHHAGCTYDDLAESVATHGLETTLRRLHDAGVHVSLDEMRGRCPIERGSLRFHAQPDEFDALPSQRSLTASTSGSSGNPGRVPYTWQFIADEAANEMLLMHEWRVLDAPGAFWMPAPPGISGIHNMLIHLRYRRPPVAWFSHLRTSAIDRLAIDALRFGAAAFGASIPAPRNVELSKARDIAIWLTHARRRGKPRYVKAYASLAVRIAQAAREMGESLDGVVFFCGGEATTEIRRSYLESTGARVAPRYAATETGVIAGSCNASIEGDAMHLYSDRIAVIDADADDTKRREESANAPPSIRTTRPLLFTSLLPSAGKILLNADLGDVGRISRTRCDCEFGRLGLDSVVSQVRSRVRYTSEGMSLLIAELESVVGEIVAAAGGSPADYLIRENGEGGHQADAMDSTGHSRAFSSAGHERTLNSADSQQPFTSADSKQTLNTQNGSEPSGAFFGSITIVLDPRVSLHSEDHFLRSLHENLRGRGVGWRIVSETWQQAGTLRLAREIPASRGGKQVASPTAIRSRR